MPSRTRSALSGAVQTAIFLVGGLVAGIVIGNLLFAGLNGHTSEPLRVAMAAIPAIGGIAAGSAAWGAAMGRLAGAHSTRRLALRGILGFVPVTIGSSVVLLLVEPVALARWGEWLPVHRLFTVLFVPTAFLITTTMTWVLGRSLVGSSGGWRMAFRAGAFGALAFLIVNVIMEISGWVVGAPGASERFTMLTVTFVGDTGAALAAGAVVGYTVGSRTTTTAVQAE